MNERRNSSAGEAIGSASEADTNVLDWRVLADRRLTRLVDLEHDCSVMRDRLNLLQLDYRELLVTSEDQLRCIRELHVAGHVAGEKMRRRSDDLARELDDLARELAGMQASRSWRVTRPLRALSRQAAVARRGVGRALRAMLRIPLLRRVARLAVRWLPGLHERLRSRLYPQ